MPAPAPELPGHRAPAAGFEVPLEMLSACHDRVARQCATLRRLVAHLPVHGADARAREAATAIIRYFDTSAVHHHADEEIDLFPALLESMAGSDAVCLRELTGALTAEHRMLEGLWRTVRAWLTQVVAETDTVLPSDEVQAFVDGYARHIAREEAELLPMAARLLSDPAIDRIGRAMRLRRGAVEPGETLGPPQSPR